MCRRLLRTIRLTFPRRPLLTLWGTNFLTFLGKWASLMRMCQTLTQNHIFKLRQPVCSDRSLRKELSSLVFHNLQYGISERAR